MHFFLLYHRPCIDKRIFEAELCTLTLPPMGFLIQGWSHYWPNVAILEWLLSIFRGHMKKSARNLKILARFQDSKILQNWDFASPWQTKTWHKTQLILQIQDSNFTYTYIYIYIYFSIAEMFNKTIRCHKIYLLQYS